MGRFGNVMLTNGETDYRAEAKVGEVVRLHLVDTANTRIFNFGISGARMKLVGGDSGRVEREEFIDEVLLSPSERAIVDVLFDQPGEVILENRTPDHTYELGRITVSGEAAGEAATAFESCASIPELSAERERIQADLWSASRTRPWPSSHRCRSCTAGDRAGGLLRLPDAPRGHRHRGVQLPEVRDEAGPGRVSAVFACPMHPEVTAEPRAVPVRDDGRVQPRKVAGPAATSRTRAMPMTTPTGSSGKT